MAALNRGAIVVPAALTIAAAPGEQARPLFDQVVQRLRNAGVSAQTGEFGAEMHVTLTNDGPVTILLDSRKSF